MRPGPSPWRPTLTPWTPISGATVTTFHHCAVCGCPVFSDAPEWTDEAGTVHPRRITLNARLFDDFDLDAVPVRRVDGRARAPDPRPGPLCAAPGVRT